MWCAQDTKLYSVLQHSITEGTDSWLFCDVKRQEACSCLLRKQMSVSLFVFGNFHRPLTLLRPVKSIRDAYHLVSINEEGVSDTHPLAQLFVTHTSHL